LKSVKDLSLDSQKSTLHHSENVEGIDPKQGSTSREEATNTEGVRQR